MGRSSALRKRIMGLAMTGAALAPAVAPAVAFAQATTPSGQDGLQEIVVTAQRRDERLQQVPLTVTALQSEAAQARGVTSTASLNGAVASLNIVQVGVGLNPFIRGIGVNSTSSNVEQSVAMYVDGVYILSPVGNAIPFNNIQRVEVLKGPQGTLFGRNATAGVIQVITKDPSHDSSVNGRAGYANYDTFEGSLYATGGIAQGIAADIALYYNRQGDGWGRNHVQNIDTYRNRVFDVRTKLLLEPSDLTRIRLAFSYGEGKGSGTNYQVIPGVIGIDRVPSTAGEFDANVDFAQRSRYKSYTGSATIDQDLGFADLTSITAYRKVRSSLLHDQDSTAVPLVRATISQPSHGWTQELRVASKADAAIDWQVGAFYLNGAAAQPIQIAGLAAAPFTFRQILGEQKVESLAGFGQVTVKLAEDTRLTGGLRYTHETQKLVGQRILGNSTVLVSNPTKSQSYSRLTWRLALDHKFSDDMMGYVSFNRGVKSGGYNLTGANIPPYKPERLDAYEIGLKSEFLDKRLRFNVSGFYYDFRDIQVDQVVLGGRNLINGAKARLYGLDIDIEARPFRELTLSGTLGVVDSKYKKWNVPVVNYPSSPALGPPTFIDASGKKLIFTAPVSASAGATYRAPLGLGGEIVADMFAIYSDSVYVQPTNRLKLPSYLRVNASLGWVSANQAFDIRLWAKNLFNKDYFVMRQESGFGDIQMQAPPRTYGVSAGFSF